MKAIIINTCEACPMHRWYVHPDMSEQRICLRTGEDVPDKNVFPEWCPLTDYNK